MIKSILFLHNHADLSKRIDTANLQCWKHRFIDFRRPFIRNKAHFVESFKQPQGANFRNTPFP